MSNIDKSQSYKHKTNTNHSLYTNWMVLTVYQSLGIDYYQKLDLTVPRSWTFGTIYATVQCMWSV